MPVSVIIVVIVTQGNRFFNDRTQMQDKEKDLMNIVHEVLEAGLQGFEP